MNQSDYVTIDFYEGAYGPTIRLGVQDREWLYYFKDMIGLLIDNKIPSITFLDQFSLKLIRAKGGLNTIEKTDEISFMWYQDKEQLETLIDLIDGLLIDERPGHQYLAEEKNILIMLAFKE